MAHFQGQRHYNSVMFPDSRLLSVPEHRPSIWRISR